MANLEKWIEIVRECKYLPENDFKLLCDFVCDLLLEEPNVQPVSSSVTVVSDNNEQFHDLEELFRVVGQVPETDYVFMGDFVDRGYYSLETLTRLMTLKARYPNRITLLRNNHKSIQITKENEFYDECLSKYGNANPWKHCCRVFDLFPQAALMDEDTLFVHGGPSPKMEMLNEIFVFFNCVTPRTGLTFDLLWQYREYVENCYTILVM